MNLEFSSNLETPLKLPDGKSKYLAFLWESIKKANLNFCFRFWLYGDKVNCEERVRGWFPRKCAVEVIDNNGRLKESKKIR